MKNKEEKGKQNKKDEKVFFLKDAKKKTKESEIEEEETEEEIMEELNH